MTTERIIHQLERLGYRVNGDTWEWNVYPADTPGLTEVFDGQEGENVHSAEFAELLSQIPIDVSAEEKWDRVWSAIQEAQE